MELYAPAIRARSKSRHHEPAEARALRRAAEMWTTPVSLPVVRRGRVIGYVLGDPKRRRTLYATASFPYPTYDIAVGAKGKGNHAAFYWDKPGDTGLAIDSWYDLWGTIGVPVAGDWSGTARTARVFTASTTGAMQIGPAVSPLNKFLGRVTASGMESTGRAMVLYDRVLSYDKCTMTASSQTMTNTATATRYISSGDPGLQLFLEADAVHNATTADLTVVTYTNQALTGSRLVDTTPTLSKVVSIAAPTSTLGARCAIQCPGATTKTIMHVPLQDGDLGITSIQNYTWSAAPTGTCSFVLQFPLAMFVDSVLNVGSSDVEMQFGFDAISKQIYDDACLSWLLNHRNASQPTRYSGWTEFSW